MKNMLQLNMRNEWFLFIIGLILTFIVAGSFFFYMNKERNHDIASISDTYTVRIESIINRAFHKTDILKSVIIMNDGKITPTQFNDLAASIYDNTPGIRALQLLPQGVVKYCYPLESNEPAMGLDILQDPRRAIGTQVVVKKHDIVLSGPYVLAQGGLGVIATNPIFLLDNAETEYLWGFAVIVLDLPDALDAVVLANIKERGYDYQLYSINELGEKLVIAGNINLDVSETYKSTIDVANNKWTLVLKPAYTGKNYLMLMVVVLIGILFSSLFAYACSAGVQARAMQVKSQLMSRVSHELRTPMNAIIGFSMIGRECSSKDDMKYYLCRISESTDYLLGLINDVLDMGNLMENKIILEPKPYKLKDFKRWLSDMYRIRALQKRISLTVNLENDANTVLMIDKSRLEQLAANLIDNAINYTDVGGKVNVNIKVIYQGDGIVKFSLSVKDNGLGISPEFQTKMFEPFEQEDKSKTVGVPGNGLGLSIVKKIVDLMQGDIVCRSDKGQGTEFVVTLIVPLFEENVLEWQLKQKDYSRLYNKHILLAEDHPINVKIAVRLLERQGMLVETAENGQQAIEMFTASCENYYDAILMDIRMPIVNGLEAAKVIRAMERSDAQTVPIIAVTANVYDEDKRKSYEAGMNAHLPKPLDTIKLYDMLAYFIVNREGE